MYEKIRQLAHLVDEEARYPEEGLKLLADADLAYPPDTLTAVKTIIRTAQVCGSTAASLAAMLSARAALASAGPAHQGCREDSAHPASIWAGALKAQPDGSISGMLRSVPFAGFAAYYVAVDTSSAPQAYLIRAGEKGVTFGEPDDKLGLRGMVTGTAFLEDVQALPLGEKAAAEALGCQRLYMAAVACGLLLGGVREAIDWAGSRIQFGKRITAFDNTRAVLAPIIAQARAAQVLIEKAAALKDVGSDWIVDANMAKLYSAQAACEGLRQCIQVMGGNGYMRDYPQEVRYRDAKTAQAFFGDTQALMDFIAEDWGIC